jgi:hypothetical protein
MDVVHDLWHSRSFEWQWLNYTMLAKLRDQYGMDDILCISGLFFDFIPEDADTLLVFVFYDSTRRGHGLKGEIVKVWRVHRTKGKLVPVRDGKTNELVGFADTTTTKETIVDTVHLAAQGPFYVFQRDGDYFFWTSSGQVYRAPRPPRDKNVVHEVIAKLDDSDFRTRERSRRELIAFGNSALEPIREWQVKGVSLEQRLRLESVYKEIKKTDTNRRAVCLWNKAPAREMIVDLDQDRTFFFCESHKNCENGFEVQAGGKLREFCVEIKPDANDEKSALGSSPSFARMVRHARNLSKLNSK